MDRGGDVYVITGGTSGLGWEVVRILLASPNRHLILGVRSPDRVRVAPGAGKVSILQLDTSSLASVRTFAASVRMMGIARFVDGLLCNAGIQTFNDDLTADGYDLTFATNHLGHFLLITELLPLLRSQAPVIITASGTHDRANLLARLTGFRGGLFPNAQRVASGDLDAKASYAQRGRDRYATSKLCNILCAREFARRVSPEVARFVAFDPGLMPGTGLARHYGPLAKAAWHRVLPRIAGLVPGVSSPERSARGLVKLLTFPSALPATGVYIDYRLREAVPSVDAQREDIARELYEFSAAAAPG